MRLAYADPPYPGCAHLYPENTEVDHAELIARLCTYDGWALSTNETTLQYVIGLCPPAVRVLAWCKSNAPPFYLHPYPAWEPVLMMPARDSGDAVASYIVTEAPTGHRRRVDLPGQKSRGFCEWIIRCLGAERDDALEDVFPGSGIMGETWQAWCRAPQLFTQPTREPSNRGQARVIAATAQERI